MRKLKTLSCALLSLWCINAFGWEAPDRLEQDNVWYVITSQTDKTLGWIGWSGYKGDPDELLQIPATVTKDGVTYTVTSLEKWTDSMTVGQAPQYYHISIPETIETVDIGVLRIKYVRNSNRDGYDEYYSNIHVQDLEKWQKVKYISRNTSDPDNFRLLSEISPDDLNSYNYLLYNGDQPVTEADISTPQGLPFCMNLEKASIASGITEILPFSFAGSASLKEISIPDGITAVGNGAFMQSGVKCITLPSSLKSIGEKAFTARTDDENRIWKINILADSAPSLGEEAVNQYATVFVPETAENSYMDDPQWKDVNIKFTDQFNELPFVVGYYETIEGVVYAINDPENYTLQCRGINYSCYKIPNEPDILQSHGDIHPHITLYGNEFTVNEIAPGNPGVFKKGCTFSVPTTIEKVVFRNPQGLILESPAFHITDLRKWEEVDFSLDNYSSHSSFGRYSLYLDDELVTSLTGEYALKEGESVRGIYHIKTVEFAPNVKTIHRRTIFQANVTEVILPSGLKRIKDEGLIGANLTEIDLPASLETIGTNAINVSEKVYSRNVEAPEVSDDSFTEESYENAVLYYPSEGIMSYLTSGWRFFKKMEAVTDPDFSGIDNTTLANPASSALYYDLLGRRITRPARGIYITPSGKYLKNN